MDEQAEQRLTLKRNFGDFLDNDHGFGEYADKVRGLLTKDNIDKGRLRLEVDLQDLQNFNAGLHRQLLSNPGDCIGPFEEALEELVRNNNQKQLKEHQRVHVAFSGEFGPNRVSSRNLTARLISKLVEVDGIVTKCSLVRPKLVKSVHYAESTGNFMTREYRDVTSNTGLPTSTAYPTRDENGHILTTEFGMCVYKNHQVITIQELPETAPPGQLPRSTEIYAEDDLVDACKPGDRVSVVGIYKAVPPRANGTTSGQFRAVLVANNVKRMVRDAASAAITVQDIRNVEQLAADPNVLDVLARSLAPSIYGHNLIKKGLILLLLGGRERNLANGTHLRGDINCLMVGDPGVAKSQLLRAVMNVAPLAVSTTGRGSSGVGLTAAITHDADTGEKRLEAGAMVLADRGIVCIDEFDKMNDGDRVAIHEVMEQQTVTIAKAGIQTSLNARCSVVAAANPLYGSYDKNESLSRNIHLPDSLLSRFDMLFVVLDNLSSQRDREIGAHVLGQHRYRAPGDDGKSGHVQDRLDDDLDMEDAEDEDADPTAGMYAKYDRCLHGPRAELTQPPLSVAFLKKFLTIIKRRASDIELTGEAMEVIGDYYAELRSQADTNALPITVRTLETIIRLSTAAAKARLSTGVEAKDVEVAKDILGAILSGHMEGMPGDDADMAEAEAQDEPRGGRRRVGRARPRTAQNPAERLRDDEDDMDVEDDGAADVAGPSGLHSASAGLTSGQVATLDVLVKEMLGRSDRPFSIGDIMQRCSEKKLALSEAAVSQALKDAQARYDADPSCGAPPIMWDEAEQKYYGLH
ncbi:g12756 [Coccomyxa viridis]|uniref:DNA replication licensing factor MCM3 n=1 Tax=Coccomyxa viridis TaxID=1274662 RepID=A0ABP1GFS9_9CHLO